MLFKKCLIKAGINRTFWREGTLVEINCRDLLRGKGQWSRVKGKDVSF